MLFARSAPEREQVKVPDKQPVFVFQGRNVEAQVFEAVTMEMSGEEFGRAAKTFLQRGLSDAFEAEGVDAIESRGMVAQKVEQSKLAMVIEEESAKKERPVVDEPSVFEQTLKRLDLELV